MASRYVFTDTAKKDLDSILEYISIKLYNRPAADNLLIQIFNTIDNIVAFPLSYPLVENEYTISNDIRKAVIDNYNLYYVVQNDIIKIITIIYNKRDLTELINF